MDERKKDLCCYRLEKARKCLSSAKVLVRSEDYCSAANRSYYCIFHCIRSLLALEGFGCDGVFSAELRQNRDI